MKRILTVLGLSLALVIPASAADAVVNATVPAGSFTVDIADFQYPVKNGCYEPKNSFLTMVRIGEGYTRYELDLTVRDSIGRVTDAFFENGDTLGQTLLPQQFCWYSDNKGAYTASGSIKFIPADLTAAVVTVPIEENFQIFNPNTTKKCKNAKRDLTRARKLDRSKQVRNELRQRKQRVCR